MILKISTDKEEGLNCQCLSPLQFADKAFHPYIATTQFDKVLIELSSDIPQGYISQLLTHGNKVIPIIREVNINSVQLLCEILPDYAAELRYTYMRKRPEFDALLEKLSKDYNWKEEIRF